MAKKEVTLKLSFYIKKNTSKPDGICPVMGRITLGKTMVQFSTKKTISLELWDSQNGKASGKSHQAMELNQHLEKTRISVSNHYKNIKMLKGGDAEISAQNIKNAYQGIAETQETLLKFFYEHNEAFSKRIGINRCIGTAKRYIGSLKHLTYFIKTQYHVSDIPFTALDITFIENFELYLRTEAKLKVNTIIGIVNHLRKIARSAVNKGLIAFDPFDRYICPKVKSIPRYLPKSELDILMNTTFDHPNRNFVRDMFVFSTFTGLAYYDVFDLKYTNIATMEDGSLWIMKNRQKTGTPSHVPLMEIAVAIIEKYKGITGDDRVFPMLSCGRTNTNLKKMAKFCGIERRLNFHMARHTFATEICLSQGIPIESISRMMGHSDIRTTQIYAKITNDKIAGDVNLLEKRIENKYVLSDNDASKIGRKAVPTI